MRLLCALLLGLAVVHAAENETMNALAERYVKLVLALGQHDADYVDAYYGPPGWKKEAEQAAANDALELIERARRARELAHNPFED